MLSIVLIGVGLSMDAFAITIAYGLAMKDYRLRHALLMAAYFGFFQFAMPLAGLFLAGTVSGKVEAYGPYISFALLAFIGFRMVWGALKDDGKHERVALCLTASRLCVLAVATSIDAFAVGVSFAFMDVAPVLACAVIGAVTFIICCMGGALCRYMPNISGKRAEILGGIVLVGIGFKLLIEGIM